MQDFPGYFSIDDNMAPSEIQFIEDLIENVNNTQREALRDNEEEDEPIPILLNIQALSAVNDLRRYVASLNQSEDEKKIL